MNLNLQLILALLAIGVAGSAADEHWGYPDLEADQEFPKWGGMCDQGALQSPIDLSVKGALKAEYDDLEFDNYDADQKNVAVVNNGHTIQLSGFPHTLELEGGPLSHEYVVEQIHFHWWSEHTIDNIRYPLEAHIVHRNKRYPNITVAANYKDGITVIGVLYHLSNQPNAAIGQISDNLAGVKSYQQVNTPIRMKDSFKVGNLLPEINGYLTYAGSLTTPTCAESVQWIVLPESSPVTLEQVNKFREIEFSEGKVLKNNYRSIQKAHNRPIIVVLPRSDIGRDGATTVRSTLMSLGLALLVAVVAKLQQ